MKSDHELALWLELAALPEVKPAMIKQISSAFYSLADLFELDHFSIAQETGIAPETALSISQRAGREQAERELEYTKANKVNITTFACDEYPAILREIPDPPIVLFSYGQFLPRHALAVAIVGSRKSTHYGEQAAFGLARDCARAGMTIVSGMAWGIDQAAHKGALEGEGDTIAVLGTGLKHIYPAGTEKLVQAIRTGGAVCTEYFHTVKGRAYTFPERNRIVAGMSQITVVIEAADRSGALITARLANEQGRDVMAVPGSIYSKQSEGCNRLIQQGAKLVRSAEDIIEEFPDHLLRKLVKKEDKGLTKTALTSDEQQVLSFLSVDTPEHIDIIARQMNTEPAQLSATLLQLEINGIVRQLPGMKFVKTV